MTELLRATTDLLERIVSDRGLLLQLSAEERQRLLQAVAEVYNPDVAARRQMIRATQRQRKRARIDREEGVLQDTGIRRLRRQAVFISPNVFPPNGV